MPDSAQDTARSRRLWIMGPVQDLLLFVATPVLILPAVLGLGWAGVSSAVVNKWVMALGGMGHHLPGMMRAYGDRGLFRRFKTRFVVAPLLLVGACVACSIAGLHTLLLGAYLWGVWHGLMQTYGFLRIYDAKVGSVAGSTAWLDFSLCGGWFIGGVVFSDLRIDYVQEFVLSCGGPMLTVDAIASMRDVVAAVLGVVTLAYLVNVVMRIRAGSPPSPVKLLLAVTSVGWWWYSNVHVADILIGLILFEVFHDVQYLAIVWLFNRSRVEKDPGVGPFSKMLFRRGAWYVAVYVGLVFLYGAIGPWSEASLTSQGASSADATTTGKIMAGLLTASALLHFYYDGFIWKVREQGTRKNLGIQQDSPEAARAVSRWSPGLLHAGKWLVLAVPVVALVVSEVNGTEPRHRRARLLADLHPTLGRAQLRLGVALKEAGDVEGALGALEQAHALDREEVVAKGLLALTLIELGETRLRQNKQAEAEEYLHRAYLMDRGFVGLMYNEGRGMLLQGDPAEAAWRFRAVLAMKPEGQLGPVYLSLALSLEKQGRPAEALRWARAAQKLMPGDPRPRETVRRLFGTGG